MLDTKEVEAGGEGGDGLARLKRGDDRGRSCTVAFCAPKLSVFSRLVVRPIDKAEGPCSETDEGEMVK